MVDNREKFKGVKWVQGCLLNTEGNRRWSVAVRDNASYVERKRAYYVYDKDNKWLLVYEYDTPELCEYYVNEHNKNLMLLKPESSKIQEIWVNL